MSQLFNLKPFLQSGAVLFIGMTIGNVGAYLLNLIAGRMLGPIAFGEYLSLISLAAILTMPAVALSTIAAKFSSTFIAENKPEKVHGLFRLLNQSALFCGLIFLVVVIIFSPVIRSFLNLEEISPIIALAVSFALSFILPVSRGFLQGTQRFLALAVNTGLEPILKIIGLTLFVMAGFSVSGALAGWAIAFTACFLLAVYALKPIWLNSIQPVDRAVIWQYAGPTTISIAILTLITFLDVILVKHYFSPSIAGMYASLATVGKIILYIGTPLITVMFPLIATKVSLGEKHVILLAQTILLMLTSSFMVLAIFALFPNQSIELLFGASFLPAAPYLVNYGIAMLLLSFITVLTHYFLSIGFTRVSLVIIFGFFIELVLITRFHTNINQIINSLIASFSSVLLLLITVYLIQKRAQLTQIATNLKWL